MLPYPFSLPSSVLTTLLSVFLSLCQAKLTFLSGPLHLLSFPLIISWLILPLVLVLLPHVISLESTSLSFPSEMKPPSHHSLSPYPTSSTNYHLNMDIYLSFNHCCYCQNVMSKMVGVFLTTNLFSAPRKVPDTYEALKYRMNE